MPIKLALATTLLAVVLSDVAAQTTLYIPGADPQPITASVLGVGSGGETTWLLGPGVSSGTLDDVGIPGPATLIEGPNTAKFIFDFPADSLSLEDDCEINDGVATCVVVVATDGTTVTTTTTETVVPFTVQGGGPAPTAVTGSSTAVVSTPSAGSGAGTGASQTAGSTPSAGSSASSEASSSSSGAAAPIQTENGAGRMASGFMASAVAAGVALIAFL